MVFLSFFVHIDVDKVKGKIRPLTPGLSQRVNLEVLNFNDGKRGLASPCVNLNSPVDLTFVDLNGIVEVKRVAMKLGR